MCIRLGARVESDGNDHELPEWLPAPEMKCDATKKRTTNFFLKSAESLGFVDGSGIDR